MKNMKKEYRLLILVVLLLLVGWILEYVLVSSKQVETKKIAEELDDRKSQLLRDEMIQQKVYLSRDMYDNNVKSNENFAVINTIFIEKLQNLLSAASIKYNPNDIQQVNTTAETVENQLAFYSFELNFTTSYASLLQFCKSLEKDKLLFDVVNLTISRIKNEKNESVINEDGTLASTQEDNGKRPIKVSMKIQITKFI